MYPTQNRQTLYYLLITLLNKIGINIILFQKILLSFSISSIVIFIGRNTSIVLGLVTYSLIIFNSYYISYSKTILPESILFSLLNLAIVYLFEERKHSLIIFALILLYFIYFTPAYLQRYFLYHDNFKSRRLYSLRPT